MSSGNGRHRNTETEQVNTSWGFLAVTLVCYALLGLAHVLQFPAPLRSLLAAVGLLIVPGFGWARYFNRSRNGSDLTILLFTSMAFSSLLLMAAAALTSFLLPEIPSFRVILAFCLGASLIGHLAARHRKTPSRPEKSEWLALAAAVMLFFLLDAYSVRIAPPLYDAELEVATTAGGLMEEFTPLLVTDRDTLHYFAHPPLLHFYEAGTLILTGEYEAVRFYYSVTRKAIRRQELGWDRERLTVVFNYMKRHFEDSPIMRGARAPNHLLTALSFLAVFSLVRIAGGGTAWAFAAAVFFTAIPEIFIRGSIGGYTPITIYMLIVMAYLSVVEEQEGAARYALSFIAGLLGILANQKCLLILPALASADLHRLLFTTDTPLKPPLSEQTGARPLPRETAMQRFRVRLARLPGAFARLTFSRGLVAGLLAGLLIFTVWGGLSSWQDFRLDFIELHGLERFSGNDLRLSHSKSAWYPSITELWSEMNRHSGWFMLLALPLIIVAVRRLPSSIGPLLFWWALVGSLAFSLTDWRMTKHLMLILPPLVTAVFAAASHSPKFWRYVIGGAIAAVFIRNLHLLSLTLLDFSSLTPTPLW